MFDLDYEATLDYIFISNIIENDIASLHMSSHIYKSVVAKVFELPMVSKVLILTLNSHEFQIFNIEFNFKKIPTKLV
jgi:hypothetical protein